MDFADNSFDLVTCRLALHHFEPELAEQCISEMARVCVPGGRVALIDIVASETGVLDEQVAQKIRHRRDWFETVRDPTHTKCFRRSEIADFLSKAGLDVAQPTIPSDMDHFWPIYEVPIRAKSWFDITRSKSRPRKQLTDHLCEEIIEMQTGVEPPGEFMTGLRPFFDKDSNELYFMHDWAIVIGKKH